MDQISSCLRMQWRLGGRVIKFYQLNLFQVGKFLMLLVPMYRTQDLTSLVSVNFERIQMRQCQGYPLSKCFSQVMNSIGMQELVVVSLIVYMNVLVLRKEMNQVTRFQIYFVLRFDRSEYLIQEESFSLDHFKKWIKCETNRIFLNYESRQRQLH